MPVGTAYNISRKKVLPETGIDPELAYQASMLSITQFMSKYRNNFRQSIDRF